MKQASAAAMSHVVLVGALSLLSRTALGQKIPQCTKLEMDNLLLNQNVQACASGYTNLLPNKGCESGLADQACYCHSPEFMAAVTGCLFKEEPDVQEELLRCGKWYMCDTLGPSLNDSSIPLTPESTALLARGKDAKAAANAAAPRFSAAVIGWSALTTLLATATVAFSSAI